MHAEHGRERDPCARHCHSAALAGSQEEQRRLTPSDIAAMATKCDCADVTFFARERIMAALARMFQVVARDALIDIAELPK